MKQFLKEWYLWIVFWIFVWNAFWFIIGACGSGNERDRKDCKYDEKKDYVCVDTSHSGCIYKSLSSILNPSYVLGCELFRKRFEYEGIEKVILKTDVQTIKGDKNE